MAEPTFGFSGRDAKRIGKVVNIVEGSNRGATGIGDVGRYGRGRPKVWGKLDGAMSPGGTATLSIWSVDPTGGLNADTTDNVTIVDPDIMPLDVTLASGTVCSAYFNGECYVLDGYRCTN